ncbi:alpha/beta fold hydrolase [Phycicoccus sp.]|uniref:alpha/beta fold hydrolase n=1 Tax=Phycicoccus sp. TaxID=1902410 RepID=UPI002C280D4E|nr:alpha/beta fold hydrolase [Phycicoccus sp.]HMM96268.1 alpha/beta fold hydrolase [Phycicoccus sp.]
MATAQLGDVEIAYEVDGPDDGIPMLLVMGLGTQLVGWPTDFVASLVERGFRVVRHDNRDIGLSSFTDGPAPARAAVVRSFLRPGSGGADYLLSDMAEDARALLDHLGIAAAHVVGASMGGMIAQQLTIDHPERVLSLTSIMSNTGSRRHGRVHPTLLPTMALSLTQPRPSDEDEAVRLGVEGWRRISGPLFDEDEMTAMVRTAVRRSVSPIGTVRQLLAILESPDRTARLREVRVPTLVVHGLADRLVGPSGGIATARAVPGSRLLMFPDMGHDLPRSRREEIVDAIAQNAARAAEVPAQG